ncbi:helix-turn-helix transcriptional regulator [Streptomyces shaanxiensis]|uniref:LuxR family transcriptional regulator n=1 Tax=Streptomyces shaanxiensis TaxID=653357 RepID=A0ABP7V6A4_9ACTN
MTGTDRRAEAGCTGLIERDAQWADLTALLSDAVAGSGRVALVTGPVACGRTELLHRFGERCGERFVSATCSALERDLPFGVAGQLLHALGAPAEVRDLLDAAARTAGPATAHQLHTLCLALLDLAADSPLVIGVDDVQHADPQSLHWLLSLVRRLGRAGILLLLARTASPGVAHSPLHTELSRHPHCHEIGVAPLSEAGMTDLFGGADAGREAMALTGGNPLLARCLLADRRTAGPDADGAPAPGPGFRRALVSCVHRCEPYVVAVARALAVTGAHATVGRLGRLAGLDVEAVRSALDLLTDAGLLADGRFRTDAARTAVLDDMPADERGRTHRSAALLLHDEGAPATEVAPYLLRADGADRADESWAVPVFEEAAEHALREERIDTALRCLERAHRACPEAHRRAAIAAKLVRVESRVNPAAAGRRLTTVTDAMRAGRLSDRDVRSLVPPLLWHGRVDEAAEAMERLRRARHQPGTADRTTELWLACTHPPLARRTRPPAGTDRDSGPAGGTTGPALRAVTALTTVLTQGPDEHAVTDAEHVLQVARPSDGMSWGPQTALPALHALVHAGRLDLARSWCDKLLDDARARDLAVAQALYAGVRGDIALREGDLAGAHAHARDALTLMPPGGWGVAVGVPLGVLVETATKQGRHEEAAAHLTQPVPDAMFQSRYGLPYLHARGHHYLATDRHYAALADFLSCGELMTEWGIDQSVLVPWRTSAAEAWLRHGKNRDEAKRLLGEQLARLGPETSRTRGVALRLLAATTAPQHRPRLLDEAVAVLEECGDQYELARALGDLSNAHQALREHRRAWSVARRAWHVANVCDATALRDELLPSRRGPDDESSEEQPPTDPISRLTDAERRVAALAAVGLTNREIAGKLFITPSTIEQHLTRVYRKLNVKYRKDLPTGLHSHLPDTA